MQVLRNPHWTLVTLLLCNAAALEVGCQSQQSASRRQSLGPALAQQHLGLFLGYSVPYLRPVLWLLTLQRCPASILQALPIFLDKLVSPVLAIILSVTAVLTFGELHAVTCTQ